MDTIRYEYDEAASQKLHMDVVHEVVERSDADAATAWIEAQRRLNSINDSLARKIIELHRDCGTGNGECDGEDRIGPDLRGRSWPCETTQIIADHFDIDHP